VRPQSLWRDWLGSEKFPYEDGRYVLVVALACPWANRVQIVHGLKKLGDKDRVRLRVVHPTWQQTKPDVDSHCGWVFAAKDEALVPLCGVGSIATPNCDADDFSGVGAKTVRALYEAAGDSIERGGRYIFSFRAHRILGGSRNCHRFVIWHLEFIFVIQARINHSQLSRHSEVQHTVAVGHEDQHDREQ